MSAQINYSFVRKDDRTIMFPLGAEETTSFDLLNKYVAESKVLLDIDLTDEEKDLLEKTAYFFGAPIYGQQSLAPALCNTMPVVFAADDGSQSNVPLLSIDRNILKLIRLHFDITNSFVMEDRTLELITALVKQQLVHVKQVIDGEFSVVDGKTYIYGHPMIGTRLLNDSPLLIPAWRNAFSFLGLDVNIDDKKEYENAVDVVMEEFTTAVGTGIASAMPGNEIYLLF